MYTDRRTAVWIPAEAANARRFAAAHADLTFVAVPKELPALCTPTVLTTQWVRGRPMKALSAAEKVAMARMSVECSVAQLLSTGVLHADPHEGNLLYGDDGRLYFLDFGLLSLMEQRCAARISKLQWQIRSPLTHLSNHTPACCAVHPARPDCLHRTAASR